MQFNGKKKNNNKIKFTNAGSNKALQPGLVFC